MDKTVIWAVVILTGLALLVVGGLAALSVPIDGLVQLILLLVGPTVTSLFTLVRVESMRSDVREVKKQTNGSMAKLIEKIPPADRE